jgi:hypothetical protein
MEGKRRVVRMWGFCPDFGNGPQRAAQLEVSVDESASRPLERLCTFRFQDIALPVEQRQPFVARLARPKRVDPNEIDGPVAPQSRIRDPAPHALHQAGGGTVIASVEGVDGGLQGSTLLLGFARLPASGPSDSPESGYRWIEVTLGERGRAILPDVAPGRYLVRMRYAGEPLAALQKGRDDNEHVVRVQPGMAVTLPPLRRAPGR